MRRWMKMLAIALALLAVVVGFGYESMLQRAADYLSVEDTPVQSDVVIVLGGEQLGERTRKAVELYRAGYAKRLLFSDGTTLSWRLRTADEMTALARQLGVPEAAIQVEDRSRSTYENALYSRDILLQEGWTSAIVVSTEWHMRRSKHVFDKLFAGSGIQLHYIGTDDPVIGKLDRWWRDSEKQQTVLTEWSKLLVYGIKY